MRTMNLIFSAIFAAAAVWTLWARVQWPPVLAAVLLAAHAAEAALDARGGGPEGGK